MATSLSRRRQSSQLWSLLPGPPWSHEERRAFEFYVHRAGPFLAGAVDTKFWATLVPQLCQIDSMVLDAVLSISLLFEHSQEVSKPLSPDTLTSAPTGRHHRQALKCYDRAVASLRQRIEQSETDHSFALLSCVLFICIEAQQGHISNSLTLIQNGLKLFSDSLPGRPMAAGTLAIDHIVTPFFARHAVLMATMGFPLPPEWTSRAEEHVLRLSVLSSISSLDEAKTELYPLLYQSNQLIRAAVLLSHDPQKLAGLKLEQLAVLKRLREWRDQIDKLASCENNEEVHRACSNLLMYYGVSFIWLSACTSQFETAFDEYKEAFAEIVHHAETSLILSRDLDSAERPPPCASEFGVVPPLYFTATKCRDPMLRRKALALIRQAPMPEGIWPAFATERSIAKIIALEEGREDGQGRIEDCMRPESRPLPPEERRVHDAVAVKEDRPGRGPMLSLQVFRFYHDARGARRMVEETVRLDD